MSYNFRDNDIKEISSVLDSKPEQLENQWSWKLSNDRTKQSLVFSIFNQVNLGKGKKGSLISVQTHHGYYELHDCIGFLTFEPDEVIFISSKKDAVSSMIIGKQCTCSMYSNISRDILKADFSSLDPAVLLSAMQLSITEEILP